MDSTLERRVLKQATSISPIEGLNLFNLTIVLMINRIAAKKKEM